MSNLTPIAPSMPALNDAPLDTTSATTYTDVNGLAALKRNPDSPQAISAVAQQVEALFLQMMLKSMRDASAAVENGSNEMGMYQDMFDKQVALSISQHSDLGIARILKRQLSGKTAPAATANASTVPPPRWRRRRRVRTGATSIRAPSTWIEPHGTAGADGARNGLGLALQCRRVRRVSICARARPAMSDRRRAIATA